MAKRQCQGTTKAGNPCPNAPMHGKDHCFAHDKEAQESGRFGGAQPGAGRPRNPRVVDVMREKVEEELDAILEPYFRALKGAMLYGTAQGRGEIVMSDYPDLGARIAAAEKLLDRVYGKPRQQTEITGAEGGPIAHALNLRKLTDEQLAALEAIQPDADSTVEG